MDKVRHRLEHELDWWIKFPYKPEGDWVHYDYFFAEKCHVPNLRKLPVADVGSGPTPYACHIMPKATIHCVDPLAQHYVKIAKYARYQKCVYLWITDIATCQSAFYRAVICTNTLDHVDDPWALLDEMARIAHPQSLFLLMCDVDREPDELHPVSLHTGQVLNHISRHWVIDNLLVIPQWKENFRNEVLFVYAMRRT